MVEQAQERLALGTIGERLREAREAKGLSLEDVAGRTRIPVRHLVAIEREDWDALPAITYCVGFVRSYANTVGLDGAVLGRELRDSLGGFRTRAPAPEYYQPADPSRVPPRSLAIVAALVAIVLIIGYLVWRSSIDDADPAATSEVNVTAPAGPTGAPAPPPQPLVMAGQMVTLSATEESWIRVEDQADGSTLFQGILASGQTFQIPSTAQRPVIRTARPHVVRIRVGNVDVGPVDPVERTVSNVSLRSEDLSARSQATPPATAPAQ